MEKESIIQAVMANTNWHLLSEVIKTYNSFRHKFSSSITAVELETLATELLSDLLDNPEAVEARSDVLVAFKNTNEELFVGYGVRVEISGGNSWAERKNPIRD